METSWEARFFWDCYHEDVIIMRYIVMGDAGSKREDNVTNMNK